MAVESQQSSFEPACVETGHLTLMLIPFSKSSFEPACVETAAK